MEVNNGLIGACPGHPFLRQMLQQMRIAPNPNHPIHPDEPEMVAQVTCQDIITQGNNPDDPDDFNDPNQLRPNHLMTLMTPMTLNADNPHE